MANFLIAAFNYGGDANGRDQIQETVEGALDWYRFAPHGWVLWTNRIPRKTWYKRIHPKITENTTFLICELNADSRQGWMQKDFWEWLEIRRAKQSRRHNSSEF